MNKPIRSTKHGEGPKRDLGLTLPELLVSMMVTGLLVAALATAFSVVARSQGPAEARIAASKDVSFVQTWLPIDLASAKELNKEPSHQPAEPAETLPGTNVITIRRVDLSTPGNPDILIAYRYVYDAADDEWQLVRYEIRNEGQPSQTVQQVGVAHFLPSPPVGWTPGVDFPSHAVDLTTRNPTILREAGENVTVFFQGGDSFVTGGAGLGPGSVLPGADNPDFADPPSPPSRCGGDVAVIVDSSGSVAGGSTSGLNNGIVVKNEVQGIINNFVGTPTNIKLYHFNTEGHTLWPLGRADPFISLLNDGPTVDTLRSKVGLSQSGPPNGGSDGIQYGGYTNWEDGLRIALTDGTDYSDDAATIRSHQSTYMPDLVIFITDGQPNRLMKNTVSFDVDSADTVPSAQAAQIVANALKSEGVAFKGVFVGPAAATYMPNLKTAIGPIEWEVDPSNAPVGNALTADVFQGGFGDLGEIFRQIFVAECGGTMTVQKRVDGSAPSSGTWTYTTSNGVKDLNVAVTPSITLGYSLGSNSSEWVPLIETPVSGHQFTGITCTSGVNPIDPSRIRDLVPADTGKEILVNANEAISCLVHSVSVP